MNESSNFTQSINDGLLLDFTDLAKTVDLFCPTFVTKRLWTGIDVCYHPGKLAVVLDFAASGVLLAAVREGTELNQRLGIAGPLPLKWPVGISLRVSYFDGYGLVIVVGDFEEDLDFRVARPGAEGFYTI